MLGQLTQATDRRSLAILFLSAFSRRTQQQQLQCGRSQPAGATDVFLARPLTETEGIIHFRPHNQIELSPVANLWRSNRSDRHVSGRKEGGLKQSVFRRGRRAIWMNLLRWREGNKTESNSFQSGPFQRTGPDRPISA